MLRSDSGSFFGDCLAGRRVDLSEGARVILLFNLDLEAREIRSCATARYVACQRATSRKASLKGIPLCLSVAIARSHFCLASPPSIHCLTLSLLPLDAVISVVCLASVSAEDAKLALEAKLAELDVQMETVQEQASRRERRRHAESLRLRVAATSKPTETGWRWVANDPSLGGGEALRNGGCWRRPYCLPRCASQWRGWSSFPSYWSGSSAGDLLPAAAAAVAWPSPSTSRRA